MAQKKNNQPRLTLHQLLIALSFWGSSVRILLVGFLALAVLLSRLLAGETDIDVESFAFIYFVGSVALLDIGYVMLARTMKLRPKFDALVLLVIELAITAAYIIPAFAYVPVFSKMAVWTILVVLLTLGIRTLLGLLYGRTSR